MTWQVGPVASDSELVALFEKDRGWTCYPLCDVVPPYREYSTYLGAWRNGMLEAILLQFSPPGFQALCTAGSSDGIAVIMHSDAQLPRGGTAIVGYDDLEHMRQRYSVESEESMLRMTLTADVLRMPATCDLPVRQLASSDRPAITALYGIAASVTIGNLTLDHGISFGAFDGEHLVAIAATHAVNVTHGMATIGGVFTHPDYRGRGLAGALTAKVTAEVVRQGVKDIALNVVAANVPARRAYTRIGFTAYREYPEAQVVLRD